MTWLPKYAEVDPDSPRAWGTCDRCGFIWNLNRLSWQYSYLGTVNPQNTRILVCQKCMDPLNPQDMPYILPPDPPPIFNARPEAYTFNEASWLITDAAEVITTEEGEYFSTQVPLVTADTSLIYCGIISPAAAVSSAYLDLFNGDPSTGGLSVLETITGSSVRTDIGSTLALAQNNAVYINTTAITISAASEAATNVSWLGLYSASISGSLLFSGEVSVSQTVALGNPVVIASGGLTIYRQ